MVAGRGSFLLCCCTISCSVIFSEASMLTCRSNFTCPGSPVVCECGGLISTRWTVTSANGRELVLLDLGLNHDTSTSDDGLYYGIVCTSTGDGQMTIVTSKLNFTFTENVSVQCTDNDGDMDMFPLHKAGSPSTPMNLRTPTATDSAAARLDWDPPLNDGGAAITNYLIFVNMSQQVVSTDTTTTLTLNFTGQHLIEISAVNECGLVGGNVSIIIITDFNVLLTTTSDGSSPSDTRVISTSAMPTTSTNTCGRTCDGTLLTLNSGGVVGVVIALLVVIASTYTCGILTGLLVRRKKNHTPSASGDLSAPTYEQVLPPSQTNISLKENEAYGHFNS